MITNVKEYIEPFVALNKPIPYKSLQIFPIKMNDYYDFMFAYDVINIEKNKIPNVEIIQMTYLDFMFTNLMKDKNKYNEAMTIGDIWAYKFAVLMEICLNAKPHEIDVILDNNKINLKIKGEIINAKEFDEIRKIIMFQNIIDYDDTPMSDDFKKVVEKYYSLKNKNMVMPTIEDKKNVIITHTSYKDDEIKDITYRTFEKMFSSIVGKTDFLVNAIFKSQGAKEPLEHWIYKNKKEKYAEIFSDAEKFAQQFS